MAGVGDLLASCLEIGAAPALIAGIEIDGDLRNACSNRLPQADCILGSAFDPNSISLLPKTEWGLVIGNPPYIFARESKNKGFTPELKKYFYDNFELAEYQLNLYPLFIEQANRLLKKEGIFSFITPNNWMTINTNSKLTVI
jgi:adenine-specific DNA methylase